MDEETLFAEEYLRIRFRRAVMSLPGGANWLAHIARLFGTRERFFAPGNFGFPNPLRIALSKMGW